MPSYDFCITRKSDAFLEKLHARVSFGDLDPGKEVARVIASQRFKRASTREISVTDYDATYCPGEQVEEATVTASGEELQHLAERVAAGDLPGAATAAATIVVGVPVTVITGVGDAIGGIIKNIFP